MNISRPTLRWQLVAIVVASIAACQHGDPAPKSGDEERPTTTANGEIHEEAEIVEKTDTDKPQFEPGPAIDEVENLVSALDGEERRLRLPVVVSLQVTGIDAAAIAAAPEDVGEDSIRLHLEDGAMGIPLHDRLRRICSDGDKCAVWLEGYWDSDVTGGAPTMNIEDFDADDDEEVYPFSVRAVSGVVEPPDSGVVRIQREISSPGGE